MLVPTSMLGLPKVLVFLSQSTIDFSCTSGILACSICMASEAKILVCEPESFF
jgi:hypothetical protein